MANIFQRIGDVAFDVMKGAGAVIAPFNPLLGGAIAAGGMALDAATDWEKQAAVAAGVPMIAPTSSPFAGSLTPYKAPSHTLPPAVSRNIPGGGILDWAMGKVLGPSQPVSAPSYMAPRPGAGAPFPTYPTRGPVAAQAPQTAEFLKQFQLPSSSIRLVPRAPAGYVVLYDASGQPFAILKQIARAFKLWRPKQKPPISVRDWNALKRGARTVNKMKRVVKLAKTVGTRRKALSC